MVAPLITALPTPPARNDPANFAARGDAFLLALPQFQVEANAVSEFVDFRIQQAFDAGLDDVAANAASAAVSETAASGFASSAAASAASAATLYDQFDDRYLGPKAANPTVDNDGNALLVGAMYFNTTAMETRVWNGTTWQSASVNGGTVNALTVTGAFEYQGTLTGGTGVINIGGGQFVKDAAGDIGINVAAPTSRLTIGQGTFDAAASGTSGLYTAATGLFTLLTDGFDISTRAGVNRFTLVPAGNAGLGVTPSASWGENEKVFDIAGASQAHVVAQVNSFNVGTNYLINASANAIYQSNGFAVRVQHSFGDGAVKWFTAPSGMAGAAITFNQAMALTNVGNLLVGTPIDNGVKVQIQADGVGTEYGDNLALRVQSNGSGRSVTLQFSNNIDAAALISLVGANLAFGTTGESARITSSRYFKASNTGTYKFSGNSEHEFNSSSAGSVLYAVSTSLDSNVSCFYADLPSGAGGNLFIGKRADVTTYQVLANGDVRNTNNSYGAISDPKLKDIIGSKSSTWEKTKQYNWIEYYLKSDTDHAFKMLGLNAEEAVAISPGVVDESPDLIEVTKVRQVPVRIVRLDENDNPVIDQETGEVIYDEVMVDEEYTEREPNGEFTKSVKYSVVSMQYHRTTQECQQRIEDLETAKVQTDDLIQQIMGRVAALESASA